MIYTKICGWLMDNADAPIRYRVAGELLKDDTAAKNIEPELLENKEVQKWLANLKPNEPVQYSIGYMEHGSFDFCLENTIPKLSQLGLHGGFEQVIDAVNFYVKETNNFYAENPHYIYHGFGTPNLLLMANIKNETALKCVLGRLDRLYDFVKQGNYDIYISEEEKKKLTGIPQRWKDKNFIKPELFKESYRYPLIYDILGLRRLYDLNNPEVDEKINGVIDYISTDEFHSKISDGYGILISGKYESGNPKYHGMGWDPKYPGWFDVASYIGNNNTNSVPSGSHRETETGYVPKLLFFAEHIVNYPIARKTKWFNDLLDYLEKYKTENGTYIFPKEWLPEKSGYAVGGFHMSFGENRRKKTWLEIESTFYMQLLTQNI